MRFDLRESIMSLRAGCKTQTRRRDGRLYWLAKLPGSHITIVHRGRHLGTAVVRSTWREYLAQADWAAEGYVSWLHFFNTWYQMHPQAQEGDLVTVIEFSDIKWREESKDAPGAT